MRILYIKCTVVYTYIYIYLKHAYMYAYNIYKIDSFLIAELTRIVLCHCQRYFHYKSGKNTIIHQKQIYLGLCFYNNKNRPNWNYWVQYVNAYG